MDVDGILETCLYAADLPAAAAFYRDVIGLEVHADVPERHVFFRCGPGMLLLFNPDTTEQLQQGVPAHGARGAGHVCFRIEAKAVDAWRERFAAHGVAIEAEADWPGGGTSLYVRDPAGNCVEVGPGSIWGLEGR